MYISEHTFVEQNNICFLQVTLFGIRTVSYQIFIRYLIPKYSSRIELPMYLFLNAFAREPHLFITIFYFEIKSDT